MGEFSKYYITLWLCFGLYMLPAYSYIIWKLKRQYPDVLFRIYPKGFRATKIGSQVAFDSYLRSRRYKEELDSKFKTFVSVFRFVSRLFLVFFGISMIVLLNGWGR